MLLLLQFAESSAKFGSCTGLDPSFSIERYRLPETRAWGNLPVATCEFVQALVSPLAAAVKLSET
ncbi:hypothetical protein [Paeniglutamicibacter psychrophenolicus]|uniref:hypothetical protein n=1 Tax=Paeniglutamicibacter psychrophenolicus TaxID=257454 RepID=UPI00278992BE|nr:hypothetical protein [Paeniglutamicibacter psychrophenolicus]MDQ0093054.1 hypothetical protein [Paeniglutamicibacter psychrophenolicus]